MAGIRAQDHPTELRPGRQHQRGVVETSHGQFRAREASKGLAAVTNYWHEETGGAKDERYSGIIKAAGDGKLGVAELQGVLAGASLPHGMNVQSVILEPATRTVHIAHGKPPLARGTWHILDTSLWLGSIEPR